MLSSGAFTDHNEPSASALCKNLFAKQIRAYDSVACMYLFHGTKVCDPRFQERFDVFYMAVNCEWARRRGVCGSRGASSRTGPVYRDILHTGSPFLSLRSTRRPLISTSCLPSNSSDYRREPLEFMIAK